MNSLTYPRSRTLLLTLAVLSLTATTTVAGVPSDLFKTTDWLAANLDSPGVRIVDLRYGIEYYWEAHVPGAVHLYPDALTLPENGVPSKPIPPRMFTQVLGGMGITDSTTVVAYSEIVDSLSPYLTWLLDYVGHKHQALVVGEFDRWRSEGRPLVQDFPRIEPAVYASPAVLNEDVRARLADVRAALGDTHTVILDVRSPAMYKGEAGYSKRLGHIPGAINRPWLRDLTDEYTWRDPADLKVEYAKLGVTPDKKVIVYCNKGYRSTTTYVTLKHLLGYEHVAVYDGSFTEWADVADLPVETGPK